MEILDIRRHSGAGVSKYHPEGQLWTTNKVTSSPQHWSSSGRKFGGIWVEELEKLYMMGGVLTTALILTIASLLTCINAHF